MRYWYRNDRLNNPNINNFSKTLANQDKSSKANNINHIKNKKQEELDQYSLVNKSQPIVFIHGLGIGLFGFVTMIMHIA